MAAYDRNKWVAGICNAMLLALVSFVGAASAAAQTITETFVSSPNGFPNQITNGPDGALWFTEPYVGRIGRITPAGAITEFTYSSDLNHTTGGMTTGPDGALWFTDFISGSSKIVRVTTGGSISDFKLPTNSTADAIAAGPDGGIWFTSGNTVGKLVGNTFTQYQISANDNGYVFTRVTGITAGPDGNMWIGETVDANHFPGTGKIGRVTPTGDVTEYNVCTESDFGLCEQPNSITVGADGNVWFTARSAVYSVSKTKVGRVTTSGDVKYFKVCESQQRPSCPQLGQIISGADGALWFLVSIGDIGSGNGQVGRMTTNGEMTFFNIPSQNPNALSITAGPDNAMWFTEFGTSNIGRISLPPSGTSLFAATLPASRSVQVGNAATSFATILNAGPAATDCGIAPVSPVPATFAFQTTNASNAVTGTPNTRVPIAAGGAQTFVLSFAANAPYAPTNVVLGYSCAGAVPATSITGVNTLQLTFDTNPVPDMIAVGLTPSADGFARTGGANGTGLFVVATANIGIAGTLTARVRLLDATTPVTATICETDPVTSICKAAPSASVTRVVAANENATWSAFLQATGPIPPDPARYRAAVEYVDAFGVVRGATSIAVTTQ